jgi:serine/threonine-protein phosphatase 2A regulatory subunit B
MISCYSSADFTPNAKYLITRDFLTVKVWDVCNTKKPVSSVMVQEGLKGKLCEMFENDCIFDKFRVSASPDGNTFFTGNYNNAFHLIDADGANTQYELNFKKSTVAKPMVPGKGAAIAKMDYTRKVLAGDFNPRRNMVAVAALNCFYIYSM